jgi:hypothetical protein
MRERDLEEFAAISPYANRADAAELLAARYGARPDVWTAGYDEPVCVFGTYEGTPNVVTLLFFATPEFEKMVLPFTRYVTRELFPSLFERGVYRVQCMSISHYAPVHRWLETLGLRRESSHVMGKNREVFDMFALVRPE